MNDLVGSNSEIENVLIFSTGSMSCISFFCSFYVLISCVRMKRKRKDYNTDIDHNDTTFLNLILYLSLIDCIWDCIDLLNTFYEWDLNKTTIFCIMTGMASQFIMLAMMFWQILVALYIFHLLTSLFIKFTQQKYYNFCHHCHFSNFGYNFTFGL